MALGYPRKRPTSKVLLKIRGLEGCAMLGRWELRKDFPNHMMVYEFDVWFRMVYGSYMVDRSLLLLCMYIYIYVCVCVVCVALCVCAFYF